MGSFAAQAVMLEHSEQYAGVVLSGSTALDVLAAGMAQSEGPVGLEAFNAGFENRTGYERLSRDEAEVDLYVARSEEHTFEIQSLMRISYAVFSLKKKTT